MNNIFEYKDSLSVIEKVQSINVWGIEKKTQNEPLFTIAIPTYKRATLLEKAIESALNQKECDDYNVIVVDNNPERNDETEIFMERYRNHCRLSYYKNSENVGQAANWNKCILLSNADRIILLHDDDLLSPYALLTFGYTLKYLPNDWAMVKPNLDTFYNYGKIAFKRPIKVKLHKLSLFSFIDGCAIGAPTAILLSREKIKNIGGYNPNYYPSFDYVLAVNATSKFDTYTLSSDAPLGGYRVFANESLSEDTMDSYFKMRFGIGEQVMKSMRWPNVFVKFFQSAKFKGDVKRTCDYYHYSNYVFKQDEFDFYQLPFLVCKIIERLQGRCTQYLSFVRRVKIKFNGSEI